MLTVITVLSIAIVNLALGYVTASRLWWRPSSEKGADDQ